jgi:hypothetical protein
MGLKGYRLWFMGQLDSNVQSPTSSGPLGPVHRAAPLGVAVQVAFEGKL